MIFRKVVWSLTSVLLLVLTAVRCGDQPSKNLSALFALIVGAPASEIDGFSELTLILSDASDGKVLLLNNGETLKIGIGGPDAGLVSDSEGNRIASLESDTGLFHLKVKRTASTERPIQLQLIVQARNYIAGGRTVYLTEKQNFRTVPLVNVNNPPLGVVVKSEEIGEVDSTGSTTTVLTMETPIEAVTGSRTRISIPAGTIIKSRSGAPLSGKLHAVAAHFNDRSPSSLAAFPGGFSVNLSLNESGQPESAHFLTAGFLALEIRDENGSLAESFSQRMVIKTQLPSGSSHPATGDVVRSGDTIPLWSYNESNGEWKYEGTGNVTDESSGQLNIQYTANHLSYYNLDWKQNSCPAGIINLNGNPTGVELHVVLEGTGGRGLHRELTTTAKTVTLSSPPAETPLEIKVYFQGILVGSAVTTDICTGAVTVNLNSSLLPQLTSFTLNPRSYCASPAHSDSNLTGIVVFRRSGCSGPSCPYFLGGTISGGTVTIANLESGAAYDAMLSVEHSLLGRKSRSFNFSATPGGSATVDVDYCDALSGSPAVPPTGSEDTINWNKTLPVAGSAAETIRYMVVDSQGNLFVAGVRLDTYQVVIKKFSPAGAELWGYQLPIGAGNQVSDLAVDSSGALYAMMISNDGKFFLRKISSTGVDDLGSWSMDFSSHDYSQLRIAVDSSDNLYVAGRETFNSNPLIDSVIIRKWNSAGIEDLTNWNKIIDLSSPNIVEYFHSMKVDSAGHVVILARGETGMTTRRYSPEGVEDLNWSAYLPRSIVYAGGGYIAPDSAGNIFIGQFQSINDTGVHEWLVYKYDSNHNLLWSKTLSFTGPTTLFGMAADPAGNLFLVGYGTNLASAGSLSDWVIRKITKEGDEDVDNWPKIYDYNSNYDVAYALAFGPYGELYVGGTYSDDGMNSDWWLKKFY